MPSPIIISTINEELTQISTSNGEADVFLSEDGQWIAAEVGEVERMDIRHFGSFDTLQEGIDSAILNLGGA